MGVVADVVRDPQTPQEWQHAALLAAAMLLIGSARLYGFTCGGPEIDTARCDEILARACDLGIVPTTTEAQNAAGAFVAQYNAWTDDVRKETAHG